MTYDKGAMILRMLRWQIGDAAFQQTLRAVLSQSDKSISSARFEEIAEATSHQNLRPFFTQWLDNTGAPRLQDKWTLYRLGNNQGFSTVGEIEEDLDLFQMPVEMQVKTEGKTVTKRVDVMGPQTRFTIDTFGIPRKVTLDPQRWLLRNDDALQVRVHILRGLAKATTNDDVGAIAEYHASLALDPTSSLASYRLGEIYFCERNYQAAEDAFRAALSGDGVPKWIEVWSKLQLGKIFDASGQRDRAVNEYREAIETQDDISGAVTLASGYLKQPYAPPGGVAH
jgi:aminopeptidase N